MRGLEEIRAIRVEAGAARGVAQMREVDARPEPTHEIRRVEPLVHPKRTGAERGAIGGQIDGIQHGGIIVGGGHDAGQAEEGEGRIVRMAAEAQAEVLCDRGHFGKKVDQVAAQLCRADPVIGGKQSAHVVDPPAIVRTRQPRDDVALECRLPGVGHVGKSGAGGLNDLFVVVLPRAVAAEDMQVEDGEIQQIEAHCRAAMRLRRAQFRARPVEDRHEVVADHLDPLRGERLKAALVGIEMRPDRAGLCLDRLGNRQAFHHVPRVTC